MVRRQAKMLKELSWSAVRSVTRKTGRSRRPGAGRSTPNWMSTRVSRTVSKPWVIPAALATTTGRSPRQCAVKLPGNPRLSVDPFRFDKRPKAYRHPSIRCYMRLPTALPSSTSTREQNQSQKWLSSLADRVGNVHRGWYYSLSVKLPSGFCGWVLTVYGRVCRETVGQITRMAAKTWLCRPRDPWAGWTPVQQWA